MLITALFLLVLALILVWLGRVVDLPGHAKPRIDVQPPWAADVVQGAAVVQHMGIANAERMQACVDDLHAIRR